MSKEAMKLALEALKANQPVNYCMNNNGEKFPMFSDDPMKQERNGKAIKALEEALAKQEQVKSSCFRCNSPKKCAVHGCSPLTWPSEKQEQGEPVAWMRNDEVKAMTDVEKQAWIAADGYWSEVVKDYTIPLYTTPQQRKPLTDEQIEKIAKENDLWMLFRSLAIFDFVRAIEAAHGIGVNK